MFISQVLLFFFISVNFTRVSFYDLFTKLNKNGPCQLAGRAV